MLTNEKRNELLAVARAMAELSRQQLAAMPKWNAAKRHVAERLEIETNRVAFLANVKLES